MLCGCGCVCGHALGAQAHIAFARGQEMCTQKHTMLAHMCTLADTHMHTCTHTHTHRLRWMDTHARIHTHRCAHALASTRTHAGVFTFIVKTSTPCVCVCAPRHPLPSWMQARDSKGQAGSCACYAACTRQRSPASRTALQCAWSWWATRRVGGCAGVAAPVWVCVCTLCVLRAQECACACSAVQVCVTVQCVRCSVWRHVVCGSM